MASESYSWSKGPANSRIIRSLCYLFVVVFGGRVVLPVLVVGWGVLNGSVPVSTPFVGVLLLLFLFVLVWARRLPAYRQLLSQSRVVREFLQITHPGWLLAAVLVGAGTYVFIYEFASAPRLVELLWFGGGFLFSVLGVMLLSSAGAIDPTTRTLTYRGWELELDLLADAARYPMGRWTALWLSFEPGYVTYMQRLYLLPTDIADRAWPVFEAGTANHVEREPEPSSGFAKRTVIIGALIFFGIALGLTAVLLQVDAPLVVTVMMVLLFCGFGYVLAVATVRAV